MVDENRMINQYGCGGGEGKVGTTLQNSRRKPFAHDITFYGNNFFFNQNMEKY